MQRFNYEGLEHLFFKAEVDPLALLPGGQDSRSFRSFIFGPDDWGYRLTLRDTPDLESMQLLHLPALLIDGTPTPMPGSGKALQRPKR